MRSGKMTPEQLNKLLSALCLVCGILALLFVCYWYVGMILAVVSIALGIYTWRRFGRDRMIIAGLICSGLYIIFFVLIAVSMGMYYSMIGLGR